MGTVRRRIVGRATLAVVGLIIAGCAKQPVASVKVEESVAPKDAASVPAKEASVPTQTGSVAPGEATAAPAAAARPPAPVRRTFTLPEGTVLRVRTTSTLSTKTAKSGDAFSATLMEPLVDGSRVLAGRGATVTGIVSEADPGGRVKGVASISVRLARLTLADGRTVEISTNSVGQEAPHTKKKDAAKIGIGGGIGSVIGAIAGGGKGAALGAAAGAGAGGGLVLATHGDPAVIPSESPLTFRLRSPVTID